MTWSPSESWWVRGVLAVGVLVVVITEGLGALGLIAPLPVALCWSIVVGGAVAWHRRRTGRWLPAAPVTVPVSHLHPAWWVIGVFLAVTFLIGIASAPNSWDGLTYHLPRVERWVEQGHLGFWATPVDRQLFMAPWAGFAILHLRLLTGGDALAFLPSWSAYLGCILLTSRVVRGLGGSSGQAAFGGLLFTAAPVAVLQATSVQTDLLTAFWVLCVIALVSEAWHLKGAGAGWCHALWLAFAVGLAGATKATAVFAVAPWLVLYAFVVIRRGGVQRLALPLALSLVAGLVLNGLAWLRNSDLFGRVSGPEYAGPVHLFEPFQIDGAPANLLANLAVHFGTPWANLNAAVARGLLWLTRHLFRADPAEVFSHFGEFHLTGYTTHESGAGLPLLLSTGVAAIVIVLLGSRAKRRRRYLSILIAGGMALLLHAAFVRWQPYGARLQLASLAWVPLAIPLVAAHRRAQTVLSAAAVAMALPALLFGSPRRLVGERSMLALNRSQQFAVERQEYFELVEFAVLMAGVSNCRSLGVLTSYDFPEYFLTAVTRRESYPMQWRYIGDVGESTGLGAGPGVEGLCMVLVAEQIVGAEPPGLRERFRVIWAQPPFEILKYLGEPSG